MSNPNARKGAQFEWAIVDYLREHGHVAEKLEPRGAKDEGDGYEIMDNRFYTMWEAKNAKLDLAGFVTQMEKERLQFMENRGLAPWQVAGIVIVKRRMHGIGKSYVVQTVDSYFGIGDYARS